MAKKINIKPATDLRNSETEKAIDKWINDEKSSQVDSSQNTPLSRVNFNIPVILHKRIKIYCAANGISITEKLTEILNKEFPDNQ